MNSKSRKASELERATGVSDGYGPAGVNGRADHLPLNYWFS